MLRLFVVFWMLSSYDIEVPTAAYERAIDAIRRQMKEVAESPMMVLMTLFFSFILHISFALCSLVLVTYVADVQRTLSRDASFQTYPY